jgi:DNA-binding CsgD family transcriptional regulator
MADLEQLSAVIETIYDASLDAALWPGALEAACTFVNGCAAHVFYQSTTADGMSVFHSWGDDPHYTRLFADAYVGLSPFFPAQLFLDVGTVHDVQDVLPIDEFRETRLYREWARPQGVLDALYVNLERSAAGAAAMTMRRFERDGLFGPQGKSRLGLIVPHVRRAISIGKVIDFHKANEAALARTLDGLAAAVLLVAADRRLVYVNENASAMLAAGTVLRASTGRLAAADPAADRTLQDAIAAAARGDAALGSNGVAISLAGDGRTSQVVHVLSLVSGQRREMLDRQAAAALFVRETTLATPGPLEIVAKLHNLTAGEVRVLAAVAETGSVAAMAAALGISEATVKTHLHRLFAKTGASRQADLVKLLAAHASLLKG